MKQLAFRVPSEFGKFREWALFHWTKIHVIADYHNSTWLADNGIDIGTKIWVEIHGFRILGVQFWVSTLRYKESTMTKIAAMVRDRKRHNPLGLTQEERRSLTRSIIQHEIQRTKNDKE